ncbi:SprT family zinc-dependent metalloprotease [uncultured Salinisphaera sp.]|uniref:M48 family metallopeptidase n=1 Tax=uncultured Salinisphaera sp. TaxID=359372 RepID=UPI0032B12F8E
MSTETSRLTVRGITVEVRRKPIKNLHVGVYPPDGRVRVAAPSRLDDDAIRLAVVSRLSWIRRQRQSFDQQARESPRQMVTGESHFFQGQRYRLNVVEGKGPPGVHIRGRSEMRLTVAPNTPVARRRDILEGWYRAALKDAIAPMVEMWAPVLNVSVKEARVRKMKTRWGSCSIAAGRIWLNLELIRKPPICLEYIVVHEMVHLLERHHTPRFRALMDQFLPDWRLRRDRLNRAPLAHADWLY